MKKNLSDVLPTLKLFLKTFVPLFLLVSTASWLYYQSEAKDHLQALKQRQQYSLETQSYPLKHEFRAIVSDLMDMSAHQQLHLIVDGSSMADYSALANELLEFCRNKKMYDQVRFLDETGMEIIRVNFNRGSPTIVPPEKLQSKKGRYYFEDTLRLAKGEVFVSPLDLNIEGKELERPFKPTIRFGMPVFNNKGEKRGIVVLNYLGEQFIDYLEKTTATTIGSSFTMLVSRS